MVWLLIDSSKRSISSARLNVGVIILMIGETPDMGRDFNQCE